MTTLYITRGLPASGKTTWAKTFVVGSPDTRARVNRDDLRAMLYGTPDYSWAQESAVTEASRHAVSALLAAGRDVVADDMNLRPKYVREWARFAAARGVEFEVVEFPVDVDESVRRDAERPKPVGGEVIRRMAQRYLRNGALQPIPPLDDEQPEVDAYTAAMGSVPAIIVDIDGTLAIHGDRSPYDLTRVNEDLPNGPVIEAVRAAYHDGLAVIYCSGREATCLDATFDWLERHVAVPGELHMRAAGDLRRDSLVKRDLFDAHIRDKYDVRYVLDDRQQVVDMWRALGLTVFQVAPGDF